MSDKSLKNQVAIVTGAGSGLGASIAKELAAQGASVALNYFGESLDVQLIVSSIQRDGGIAMAIEANVADPEEVTRMVEAVVTHFGVLDIMVANAGLQKDSPLLSMSLEDWNATLSVDLTGSFLCAQAAARVFQRQGVRAGVSCAAGKIVCISSVHEVIPWAGHANYAAAKGGMHAMMRTMAQEWASAQIRVNAVAPGAIRTDINRAVWSDPDKNRALLKLVPYGRIGEPQDVARAACWLASDHADYITGVTLPVDGGMLLYAAFLDSG